MTKEEDHISSTTHQVTLPSKWLVVASWSDVFNVVVVVDVDDDADKRPESRSGRDEATTAANLEPGCFCCRCCRCRCPQKVKGQTLSKWKKYFRLLLFHRRQFFSVEIPKRPFLIGSVWETKIQPLFEINALVSQSAEIDQWGSIRRKQFARWLYLSRMKNVSSCSSKKYFCLVQYAAGYHPGPVAPPRTDWASFKS